MHILLARKHQSQTRSSCWGKSQSVWAKVEEKRNDK